MNKAQLVDRLAQHLGISARDSRTMVDAIFDPDPRIGLIAGELTHGGKVAISGFGTFEARDRKARTGRNPHTGQEVAIPAVRAPAFRAGKPLKETLRAH
jgi:DNA-binding protein HU-beta